MYCPPTTTEAAPRTIRRVILKLDRSRLDWIAGGLAATAGTLSWSAYLGRLQLRSLHMLQLEGYQTLR